MRIFGKPKLRILRETVTEPMTKDRPCKSVGAYHHHRAMNGWKMVYLGVYSDTSTRDD